MSTVTTPGLRVLIVGAGIAGLSMAIALGRRGIQAQLVEKSPAWAVYGVGIILQSNAIRALDALGIAEACLASGYPYDVSTHCDAQGVVFRDRPKPNVGDARFPASCGVQRRALHDVLAAQALALGANVELGVSVRGMVQTPDHVDVMLSDGRSGTYDLVIGADGSGSTVRHMLFGDAARPTFTGQGCWRFTAERAPEVDRAIFYHGSQSVAGLIPVSQRQMYLLLLTPEPGNPRFGDDMLQPTLRARMAEYGGLVGALRSQIPAPQDIVYRPFEPVLMPAPWTSGRVAIIGDAAHSTTPHLAQGASMAFEDAVVLDELLASSGFDVPEALSRFTPRRHARCRRIIEASVQIGRWQLERWAGADPAATDPIGLSAAVLEELRAPI